MWNILSRMPGFTCTDTRKWHAVEKNKKQQAAGRRPAQEYAVLPEPWIDKRITAYMLMVLLRPRHCHHSTNEYADSVPAAHPGQTKIIKFYGISRLDTYTAGNPRVSKSPDRQVLWQYAT
jgi:hypothetical protein